VGVGGGGRTASTEAVLCNVASSYGSTQREKRAMLFARVGVVKDDGGLVQIKRRRRWCAARSLRSLVITRNLFSHL
jgi:hypothetical protein